MDNIYSQLYFKLFLIKKNKKNFFLMIKLMILYIKFLNI